jgi:predicted anti-sigma-YlaC factor YlaD
VSRVDFGCDWVREQLEHDLGAGLPAPEVEEHVARCEECRKVRRRQEVLVRTFGSLPRINAPPDLFRRIQEEIERREARPRVFRLLRYAVPAAIAATLLTAVLIQGLWPARTARFAHLPETEICTLEELGIRDAVFGDNPFVEDADWGEAYYRLLKGEMWK